MKKSLSHIIAGILCAIVPFAAHAESIEVRDTIYSDVTWSADTIKVMSHLVILDDVTLSVEPGTRVEFQGHYHMYVQGTILARGTAQDTIFFTAADTNNFCNYNITDGGWNGILFYNGTGYGGPDGAMIDNDTSRFDHCIIEFAKASSASDMGWNAIEVGTYSRVVISNCEIRNNYTFSKGGAIRLYSGSDIIIRNNYIHHNLAVERGGGIYSFNSTPVIAANTITHNSTLSKDPSHGKGGGIAIEGYNPVILNNTISYNSAVSGPGIYLSNAVSLIQSNIISHNTGYNDPPHVRSSGGGIYMEQTSSPLIISNRIANNSTDEGGGISSSNSNPEIINNLIVNNTADSAGGAMHGADSKLILINNTIAYNFSPHGSAMELSNTEANCINNILWNNGGNDIHLQDTYAELHIANSIIHGGEPSITGTGSHHVISLISEDPGFLYHSYDAGNEYEGLAGEWTVPAESPCVNAGTQNTEDVQLPEKDLLGNERIHHNVIDIGAYEVVVPRITFSDTVKSDTTWIADTVSIEGNVVVNDDVTLNILPGTFVEFQDTFYLKVNGTILAEGTRERIIQFTVADTTGFGNSASPHGGWRGIIFDNSYDGMNNAMKDNDTSILKYCRFSRVKYSEGADHWGAIKVRYYNNIQISHCEFSHNQSYGGDGGAGIELDRSNVDIRNCLFRSNRSEHAGAAIGAMDSEFSIADSWFDDNYSTGRGGAVNLYSSVVTIDHCRFTRNGSGDRGGACHTYQTETIISNCFFASNRSGTHGGAIGITWESVRFINNIVVNNTSPNAGGGVYCLYSDDLTSMNNTIAYNYANTGGGMYTAFCDHTSVNDIFYGNDAITYGKQYAVYSVTADLDFRNGLFEGGAGDFGFWIGQELTGTFTDLMDTIPHFVNPSGGAGSACYAANSDWRLHPVSPCINNGTSEYHTNLIPASDYFGNQRIYGSEIDMGAFESQYGPPVITNHPKNQILCEGDSAIFRIRTEAMSNYQWQKDGKDIPGANKQDLKLTSISDKDDGNYQCIVSNAFDTVFSNSAYLLARAAPEFVRQPVNTWAVEGERTIISSQGTGTPPLRFQWYKNDTIIAHGIYPDLRIFNTSTADEAGYHCELSNACGTVSTDTVQLYLAPRICMVTVDSLKNHNLVIWEKRSAAPIQSFNIYRESIVAGEFDSIGNVHAEDLSVFVDTMVNPVAQAYIYKITAIDNEGNESDPDLCKPHRTLHLLTSENTELRTIQCDWSPYYGFDYGTFYIYRGTTGTPLTLTHTMSSSSTTWIDTGSEPGINYYYRVLVRRAESCNPTGNTKAETGPYSHSMSNLDHTRLSATAVNEISAGYLKIYPNPFSERTMIEFPNPERFEYRITVRDVSGQVARMDMTTGNRLVIERGELAAGLYFIELAGEKIYRGRFIVE